ncbi:MAG: B12-binding domain-containing radical SAM protein [Anaerolineae bacterium]|nr:B12-binding domain-containing radical SAM protein [Anaerolineae bacterium]
MKNIKTTLIYPGIAGRGFNSLKQGMDAGWISHGLASLSAAAKAKGFEIDLIDLRALSGWDHFRTILTERDPDVVAVTVMSVDYNPAKEVLAIVKEMMPETITILGGAHITISLEDSLRIPNADYLIIHEGEITFPELLQQIAAGNLPKQKVLRGKTPDLDALPYSDRELFMAEWRKWGYDLDSPEVPFAQELQAPFATIIAGRGCIYNCSFCKPGEDYLFGKGTRRRSVDNVIGELRLLVDKYHLASFMFHDDCLTEDREWVLEFTEKYMAEGFTMPFFSQSRADIIVKNEDMVARMVKAGLRGYFIGFESGNPRILQKVLRKGCTVEQNIEAARICKKYGISIWANYMMGIPTETKEEVMDTVRMLKEIDPDYYSPAFYTPHPGTDLYTLVLENDLSLITDYDSYRRNPEEPKIRGQDYEFLKWAMQESMRRKPANTLKRWTKNQWQRVKRATPRKVMQKMGLLPQHAS